MSKYMKIKLFQILYLALLILVLNACGISQNTASGVAQDSNADVRDVEPIVQESELPEYLEAEEAEPEIQSESEIQEGEAEIQDKPEENEAHEEQIEEPKEPEEDTQPKAANQNLPVQGNDYYDLVNVILYLEAYNELPPNYITKSEAQALGWEGGSVEQYKEGAAIGGDYFGNREGLLPAADGRKYTECDIDTHGYRSRGSRRLVFSNDGLYFYTSDHYESFSEVTVTEDYEVIW